MIERLEQQTKLTVNQWKLIVTGNLADLLDFFDFLLFLAILSLDMSPLLMLSPLAAGAAVLLSCANAANPVEDRKAMAVVAMISLRMREPPFCLPAHHNGTGG